LKLIICLRIKGDGSHGQLFRVAYPASDTGDTGNSAQLPQLFLTQNHTFDYKNNQKITFSGMDMDKKITFPA